MKYVTLPCGELVAALGRGKWRIGDYPTRRQVETASPTWAQGAAPHA